MLGSVVEKVWRYMWEKECGRCVFSCTHKALVIPNTHMGKVSDKQKRVGKERRVVTAVFHMLLSCWYSWLGWNWGENEGKKWANTDSEADSNGSSAQQQKWGRSNVGHHVCYFKTTVLFTFSIRYSHPPFCEANHTHMTKYNSKHTCSVTAKPRGVFTVLHPKAPTGSLNSTEFTGPWKQQHFGFATAYIRLYFTQDGCEEKENSHFIC